MNARPGRTQIPVGPLVAALGAVLLIVSLGLDWYANLSGFNSFEVLDLLLVVLALVALAELVGALGLVRTPLRSGTPLVVGVVAIVIVLSQLVNHPPAGYQDEVGTGLWLGLAGAALMLAGAVLSTARIALAVEPRHAGAPAARDATPVRDAAPPPASSAPARSSPPADQAPTVADEPRP
jgi:hypothetical protein